MCEQLAVWREGRPGTYVERLRTQRQTLKILNGKREKNSGFIC